MSKKRGAHAKAVSNGHPYHEYTAPEQETILRTFDAEYHRGNITHFVPTRACPDCHSEPGTKRG